MPTEFHTRVKLLVEPQDPEDAVTVEWVQDNAGGGGAFLFEQTTPANTWVIGHNLNRKLVAVQMVDDSGNTIWGDADYSDANVVTLTFSQSVAGSAIVRR